MSPRTTLRVTPSVRRISLALLFLMASLGIFVFGCSGKSTVNVLLRVGDQQQVDDAIAKGKKYWGADPYQIYNKTTREVNLRISKPVIFRTAAICFPAEEIAFAVATLPSNSDDKAIKQAVDEAKDIINRTVKFTVIVQVDKTFDPKTLTFELRTNMGQAYPPVGTPEPILIREISGSLEGDIPAASLYGFDLYFETSGSPGYPPIDDSVTSLTLAVLDGTAEGTVNFSLLSTKR